MNEHLTESLSALMDDEADELELRRLLKALDKASGASDAPSAEKIGAEKIGAGKIAAGKTSGEKTSGKEADGKTLGDEAPAERERHELKAKWRRYHLIRSCARHEIHGNPSIDLLPSLHQQLEKESVPVRAFPRLYAGGALRYLGQGAIAASVAVAVLFAANLVNQPGTGNFGDSGSGLAAGQAESGTESDIFPALTGELNPGTETQVAVDTMLDEAERDRLTRTVSEELDESLETPEVPANFISEDNQ